MPLLTNDLTQARRAFELLEARAQSAEQRADTLQAKVAFQPPPSRDFSQLLRDRLLVLEAENAKLRSQVEQLSLLKADLPLQAFIAAIGMAAAIGEASMPDRAIPFISATVQSYLAPSEMGIGLRFRTPESVGLGTGLSTTSFEIVNVPSPPGVPSPRSLYAVLQEKQRVFSIPFVARFGPAAGIVTEIAKTLAATDSWNFTFLLQSAGTVSALETKLGSLLTGVVPPDTATAYSTAVQSLVALTTALGTKPNPVVGDLLALAVALDMTTNALKSFLP